MRIKIDIDLKINRLVKYFVLNDIVLNAGWGMINPVFAVFIIKNIQGATIVTVGVSASIYWILKSILQIPISKFLDKTDGEKDDFYALVLGLMITAISAFLFILANKIWQLYLVQALQSLGFALYFVAWPAIFSRHLDKDKVAFDWALDSSSVGFAAGSAGFFGAIIASTLGFEAVFILVAIFSAISSAFLFAVPDLILPKPDRKKDAVAVPKDHINVPMGRG